MDTTPPPPVPTPGPAAPPVAAVAEDKTVAIVSYLTLLGFIAAIIIHSNKKTQLGAYHLRQTLGLFLTSFLLIIPILNFLLIVVLFVLWVMGLVAAIKGEMKPVPVMGPLYQKWFGNTFS